MDSSIVYLGCQMARGAKRKVHLLHVIEVPRTRPLNSVLTEESERADALLNSAMHIAEKIGCEVVAEVVQAREAGFAIVDEVKDYHCSLLLIGLIWSQKQIPNNLGTIIPYVLANAPCKVWLVQDPR